MTLTPARIEAAARAMARLDYSQWTDEEFEAVWRDNLDSIRSDALRRGQAALAAAFPDLVSGEAWIAPREATEAMLSEPLMRGASFGVNVAGRGLLSISGDKFESRQDLRPLLYRVFRDAYLAEQSDKDKTT